MIATVVGILLTASLGVVGILLTIRSIRRTSIEYVQFDMMSLVRTIVRDMANIRISYKNEAIDPGLFLLRAAVFNTGNNDIDRSLVHGPLEVVFPAGFQIIEANAERNSTKADITVNPNSIFFAWDVFKRREIIPFNVLFKVSPEIYMEKKYGEKTNKSLFDELLNQTTFNERITNLDKIRKVKANEFNLVYSRVDKFNLAFALGLLAISAILLVLSTYLIKQDKVAIRYLPPTESEKVVEFSVAKKGEILVKEISGPFRDTLSLEKITSQNLLGIKIVPDVSGLDAVRTSVAVYTLLALLALIWTIRKKLRKRKYGRLLSVYKK
ncbi:MAG: hypothetical protein IMZ61_09070 [Planctomycetes bacterium]|nr:hypothetical protein [Planctomycetota bacterium]